MNLFLRPITDGILIFFLTSFCRFRCCRTTPLETSLETINEGNDCQNIDQNMRSCAKTDWKFL